MERKQKKCAYVCCLKETFRKEMKKKGGLNMIKALMSLNKRAMIKIKVR